MCCNIENKYLGVSGFLSFQAVIVTQTIMETDANTRMSVPGIAIVATVESKSTYIFNLPSVTNDN